MLGYVMVGTNNLKEAIIFYDEVLQILNLERNYYLSSILIVTRNSLLLFIYVIFFLVNKEL